MATRSNETADGEQPFVPLINYGPWDDRFATLERLREATMPQYWLVGAMYDGHDDQFELFIREGYWLLGWHEDQQPDQAKRRDQIRPGDRIAIKKRAKKKRNIEIRAVGFVTGIDPEQKRVYVHWVASGLRHEVYAKGGCFKSIHGPYSGDDVWTQRAFQLEYLEHRLAGSDLPDLDDDVRLAHEGSKSWHLHFVTERNRDVVESKKAQVKKEKGSFGCEACEFNFAEVYGDLGADFCEVHCSFNQTGKSSMTSDRTSQSHSRLNGKK